MATAKKGNPHGLYKILVQKIGTSGLSYGQAGATLAAGSTSQAYVLDNPKTAGLALPDRTTIDFKGGDRWIQSFQYGIDSFPSFELSMADEDATFTALVRGTNVDTTSNTEWTEYTYDELNNLPIQCSMMIIYRMQSTELATFGATYFLHRIIPRCWIAPKGYTNAYQSPGEPTFQVTPTSAARKITGEPFGANLAATNNSLVSYTIIANNPLYMVSHRVTGITASIVGTYVPISSAVGTASATKNLVVKFVESTNTATAGVADTVTTGTGTFAVGTALTVVADNMLSVLYETNYTRVS